MPYGNTNVLIRIVLMYKYCIHRLNYVHAALSTVAVVFFVFGKAYIPSNGDWNSRCQIIYTIRMYYVLYISHAVRELRKAIAIQFNSFHT